MRDFGLVGSSFWTRGSGKRLRGKPDAQIVALYLCTAATANLIGLYYLPIATVAHETGLSVEAIRIAIQLLEEVDFAHYDEQEELVYVPNAAEIQIGTLGERDKRRPAIQRELARCRDHRFGQMFVAKYGHAYKLPPAQPAPTEAPSKPLPDVKKDLPTANVGPVSPPDPDHDHDLSSEGVQGEVAAKPVRGWSTPGSGARFLMPDAMPLTNEARAMVQEFGVRDIDAEWAKYCAHEIKAGRTSDERGWYAGFRGWCVNAKKYQQRERDRERGAGSAAPVPVPPTRPLPPLPTRAELASMAAGMGDIVDQLGRVGHGGVAAVAATARGKE